MDFVGRRRELTLLARELEGVRRGAHTETPGRCLLIRGRRRVGKSRLMEVFLRDSGAPALFFTASRQGPAELRHFADEAAASSLPGASLFAGMEPGDWDAALRLLDAALPDDQASVVVIDEFPYLIERDGAVEASFQKQWDRLLSRKPVLLLLVGSDLAVMEALNTYGRSFYQRGSEFVVRALSPVETAAVIGETDPAAAFDAYLVTGGLPLVCRDWQAGDSLWDFLTSALSDETSALVVSAQRTLAAEFPEELNARAVLGAIGAGERTFTNIGRACGLQASSLSNALDALAHKRLVQRDVPLSTKPSREARYRVDDPYLRFWLSFVGPGMTDIERGRGDRVVERIRRSWPSWRGRSIEPVIREAVNRLLPLAGVPDAQAVGGYWTRTNVPEVDLIGADRAPVANAVAFAGSIKWHDTEPFNQSDLHTLASVVPAVPGCDASTPLIAVSRAGITARGLASGLGPAELLRAWEAEPPETTAPGG